MASLPDPLYIFKKNMAQICSLFLCPKGMFELLYVGTEQGFVHIWDLKTKRELKSVKVSDKACLGITQLTDYFVTQEKGFGLKYWRVVNLEWYFHKAVEVDYYGFCKILVRNERIYCPCDNGVIRVFQRDDDVSIMKCNDDSNRGEVMCMKLLKDRHRLLVAYESGVLSLWVLDDNPKIVFEIKFNDTPMCLEVCEFTEEGILGTNGESLKKFAIKNDILSETCSSVLKNPGVSCVSIRKDGRLVVAGCWDGRIRYFSMKQLTLLAVLDYHYEGAIQCVLFSEKILPSYPEDILFAAGCDGRISLWDLYTSKKYSK